MTFRLYVEIRPSTYTPKEWALELPLEQFCYTFSLEYLSEWLLINQFFQEQRIAGEISEVIMQAS